MPRKLATPLTWIYLMTGATFSAKRWAPLAVRVAPAALSFGQVGPVAQQGPLPFRTARRVGALALVATGQMSLSRTVGGHGHICRQQLRGSWSSAGVLCDLHKRIGERRRVAVVSEGRGIDGVDGASIAFAPRPVSHRGHDDAGHRVG